MDNQKTLTIEPGAWSPAASEYIARALVHASPDEVRAQVDAGAALFYVKADDVLIGCYVLRIDQTSTGREGVIVAAGGDYCGVDLIGVLLPKMEAQFTGVDRVRIHTSRAGMGKRLAAAGYRAKELVFSKDCHAVA